jgi:hypothetical protein
MKTGRREEVAKMMMIRGHAIIASHVRAGDLGVRSAGNEPIVASCSVA